MLIDLSRLLGNFGGRGGKTGNQGGRPGFQKNKK